MIICSTLPFLKDAKEIFTLFVMFNNSLIGHEDHQTPLLLWFCGLDSAQRSISISITHFDPVTIKTLNLLIHSHFARIVLPHVRESGFRNPGIFCFCNPESWALESGIQH